MNLAILEKGLQRLADALSEFDDALIDAQMNSVPSPLLCCHRSFYRS